ncbi:membrane protein insertase YidC [Coralliovum pocilloporae]|uniref:membrane protein insertase YidC n=1 Tax=Coralliovum pocilloporae TaxID=3066369 RepID=UPI00330766BC
MTENKNLILAMVLSVLILIGWQYFIIEPRLEADRLRAAAQQTQTGEAPASQTPGAASVEQSVPGSVQQTVTGTRDEALAQGGRVTIDTPRLAGSINLKGARFDDLRLKDYRETVDADSETIILFSPQGGPNAYYSYHGWIGSGGALDGLPTLESEWTVNGNQTLSVNAPVELSYDNGQGLEFKRVISVDENYMFSVRQSVKNTGSNPVTLFPYGIISRAGTPEISGFFILHEGLLGVFGEDGLKEVDYDELKEDGAQTFGASKGGWLGFTDKYWAAALIPSRDQSFTPRFDFTGGSAADAYQADYLGQSVTIAAGSEQSIEAHLFAGAKQVNMIDGYEQNIGIDRFELLIDWGWFHFITKPLFYVIDWLFHLLGNFGLAILAVTVLVKMVFFPLANKSYASMSKMKLVQPEMEKIRERFKDDKPAQQKAMMELYKKEKINPAAGCLPIFIQIPVFFALYKVLFVTIEMRQAPFFGWIQDLAAPDPTSLFNLFGAIPWDPSWLPALGIWPLIMGVTMFIQMKLNPAPPDKTQQMIFNWMPVLFTFMLASFPAGLVIYWAWNNFLSIIQQYVIMRRQGVKVEILKNIKDTFRKSKDEASS